MAAATYIYEGMVAGACFAAIHNALSGPATYPGFGRSLEMEDGHRSREPESAGRCSLWLRAKEMRWWRGGFQILGAR